MDEDQPNTLLKLDGTFGMGDAAFLTIITKDPVEGEREETFKVPFAALDFDKIMNAMKLYLIVGFKIVRRPKTEER
jgi:hypothetical protein